MNFLLAHKGIIAFAIYFVVMGLVAVAAAYREYPQDWLQAFLLGWFVIPAATLLFLLARFIE